MRFTSINMPAGVHVLGSNRYSLSLAHEVEALEANQFGVVVVPKRVPNQPDKCRELVPWHCIDHTDIDEASLSEPKRKSA
jgi:hypothetical protein